MGFCRFLPNSLFWLCFGRGRQTKYLVFTFCRKETDKYCINDFYRHNYDFRVNMQIFSLSSNVFLCVHSEGSYYLSHSWNLSGLISRTESCDTHDLSNLLFANNKLQAACRYETFQTSIIIYFYVKC